MTPQTKGAPTQRESKHSQANPLVAPGLSKRFETLLTLSREFVLIAWKCQTKQR